MADFEAMFAEVYESHFRSVHDYCRRRVSSDRVEDLVAETFLTAWRKIDQSLGVTRVFLGCTESPTGLSCISGVVLSDVAAWLESRLHLVSSRRQHRRTSSWRTKNHVGCLSPRLG